MNHVYYNSESKMIGYQEKAADIILDRMKICDPSDLLNMVLSLKELFEPYFGDSLSITDETSVCRED